MTSVEILKAIRDGKQTAEEIHEFLPNEGWSLVSLKILLSNLEIAEWIVFQNDLYEITNQGLGIIEDDENFPRKQESKMKKKKVTLPEFQDLQIENESTLPEGKYLITFKDWVLMPDGKYYRGVVGAVIHANQGPKYLVLSGLDEKVFLESGSYMPPVLFKDDRISEAYEVGEIKIVAESSEVDEKWVEKSRKKTYTKEIEERKIYHLQ